MEIEKELETKIEQYLALKAQLDAILAERKKLNRPIPSKMTFEDAYYLKLELETKEIREKQLNSEAARLRQQIAKLSTEIRSHMPFVNTWIQIGNWWVMCSDTSDGIPDVYIDDGKTVWR